MRQEANPGQQPGFAPYPAVPSKSFAPSTRGSRQGVPSPARRDLAPIPAHEERLTTRDGVAQRFLPSSARILLRVVVRGRTCNPVERRLHHGLHRAGATLSLVKADVDHDGKQGTALSPEYLAAIVDSSDDAIIGKTLDGTIISWNRGAEHLYGYTADEIVGQPISVLVPIDRPDELPGILDRLRRGERIDHYKTARIRKDGQRVELSVTISPVRDADGTIIGASAIARDISEQERAIEAALRLREDFIAIAAHELRTPMTTVFARLQLAERRLSRDDYDRDALRRDVAIVRKGADRLRGLLERLLDISRIRSGRLDLVRAPTDVVALTRT